MKPMKISYAILSKKKNYFLPFSGIFNKQTLYCNVLCSSQLIQTWPIFLFSELLTLYTLTSVCIFSLQLSKYFLRGWQGEFAWQSRASTVGNYLFYPHNLNVWFTWGEIWCWSQLEVKKLNVYHLVLVFYFHISVTLFWGCGTPVTWASGK